MKYSVMVEVQHLIKLWTKENSRSFLLSFETVVQWYFNNNMENWQYCVQRDTIHRLLVFFRRRVSVLVLAGSKIKS